MDNAPSSKGQWPKVAHFWHLIGTPLRPCPADIALFTLAVEAWCRQHAKPPRVLILGVTPEIYGLPWPEGTQVKALDNTQAMIDHVWPGPKEAAHCGDWMSMPFESGSQDLLFCDGGLSLIPYPTAHAVLARQAARVLAPGGLCVFRLFCPPLKRESVAEVLEALRAGRVLNTNGLKLRLGMAMQQKPETGAVLNEVWEALHQAEPDLNHLAERLAWRADELGAIEAYKGATARYVFLTAEEVVRLFMEESRESFELQGIWRADYPMGDQCPTVVMKRRS